MNKIVGFSFFFALLMLCTTPASAEEAQVQGSIQITTTPADYSIWKLKRVNMQLLREHNTVTICSLLQPAAAIGSIVMGALAVLLIVGIVTGGSNRDDAKDLVRSIEGFIKLVQAPFTLQYEKNKACDRIAELNEELAKRSLVEIF
jgi:hypothetical protein